MLCLKTACDDVYLLDVLTAYKSGYIRAVLPLPVPAPDIKVGGQQFIRIMIFLVELVFIVEGCG